MYFPGAMLLTRLTSLLALLPKAAPPNFNSQATVLSAKGLHNRNVILATHGSDLHRQLPLTSHRFACPEISSKEVCKNRRWKCGPGKGAPFPALPCQGITTNEADLILSMRLSRCQGLLARSKPWDSCFCCEKPSPSQPEPRGGGVPAACPSLPLPPPKPASARQPSRPARSICSEQPTGGQAGSPMRRGRRPSAASSQALATPPLRCSPPASWAGRGE